MRSGCLSPQSLQRGLPLNVGPTTQEFSYRAGFLDSVRKLAAIVVAKDQKPRVSGLCLATVPQETGCGKIADLVLLQQISIAVVQRVEG